MSNRIFYQSAIIGGFISALFDALPYVKLINALCCIGIIFGGIASFAWYRMHLPEVDKFKLGELVHLSLVTGYMSPEYVSLLEGKKTAYLMTCGGPVENNTEQVQGVIDKMASYSKADLVGKYIVAGATVPDEIEAKAADVVAKMAADLTG